MFLMFFIFEEERERESTSWGGAERGRKRTQSTLLGVSTEPHVGFELMNCEIMTWAEIKSRPLN